MRAWGFDTRGSPFSVAEGPTPKVEFGRPFGFEVFGKKLHPETNIAISEQTSVTRV
ncbi:MAG: hypothetical protein AAFU85_08030 [Planctomycetota bacterium]